MINHLNIQTNNHKLSLVYHKYQMNFGQYKFRLLNTNRVSDPFKTLLYLLRHRLIRIPDKANKFRWSLVFVDQVHKFTKTRYPIRKFINKIAYVLAFGLNSLIVSPSYLSNMILNARAHFETQNVFGLVRTNFCNQVCKLICISM